MAKYDDITFQLLYDRAKNTIKSNCVNCSSYSSIPAPFIQEGYQKTQRVQGGAGTSHKHSITAIATIVESTRILPVGGSTIDDEFYRYMVTTKKINLSDKVTTNKLYYFLNCLSAFIQTKLRIAGTDTAISNSRILIYLESSTSFPDTSNFRNYENDANYNVYPYASDNPPDTTTHFTVEAQEVVRASDVNQVLDILNKVLNQNVKPYVVKYSYSHTTS